MVKNPPASPNATLSSVDIIFSYFLADAAPYTSYVLQNFIQANFPFLGPYHLTSAHGKAYSSSANLGQVELR